MSHGVHGAELRKQQRESLWLDGRSGLSTVADALLFMNEVGIALRYSESSNLPVANMYRSVGFLRGATMTRRSDPELWHHVGRPALRGPSGASSVGLNPPSL